MNIRIDSFIIDFESNVNIVATYPIFNLKDQSKLYI